MSLLKSVTRSVVIIGKEGYKAGRRLSKLAQLSITLKLEQDKQRAYYKEIGEHVHNDQVNEVATSSKIKILREKIVTQERKIKKLVEEVNMLKQISSCTYCGYVSNSWGSSWNNSMGGEEHKICPRCSRPRK